MVAGKTSFTAPEFHAALVVRIKTCFTSIPRPWMEPVSSGAILLQVGDNKDEAWEESECGIGNIHVATTKVVIQDLGNCVRANLAKPGLNLNLEFCGKES